MIDYIIAEMSGKSYKMDIQIYIILRGAAPPITSIVFER